MGVIDSNILLEKSAIYVLKLTAKLENYWNFYSKSSDDDTYLILPGNNFKLNYETKMIKGNI